jgi:hypothetical protein
MQLGVSVVSQFNIKNAATDYQSGASVNFDLVAAYRPFEALPKLQMDVVGYVFKQFQNDTVNGQIYDSGFKGQAYGVGPQIKYDIGHGGADVLKWEHDLSVRNMPQGGRMWIEFQVPL